MPLGSMIEMHRWVIPNGDRLSAAGARRAFALCIRSLTVAPSDIIGSEVIFGELAANGLEHGKGNVTLILWRQGTSLLLSARDEGGWCPGDGPATLPEPHTEHGRGLFFLDAFGRRIHESTSDQQIRVLLPVTLAT